MKFGLLIFALVLLVTQIIGHELFMDVYNTGVLVKKQQRRSTPPRNVRHVEAFDSGSDRPSSSSRLVDTPRESLLA